MDATPSIKAIIEQAGGPSAVAAAIDQISEAAVYKWPKIGIPDRHWPKLIELSGVTVEQLYAANRAARAAAPAEAVPS